MGTEPAVVVRKLPKQRPLRCRSPKGICVLVTIATDAMFVEAESFAVNLEKLFLRAPVFTLATHPLTKDAGVQLAAARFADPI